MRENILYATHFCQLILQLECGPMPNVMAAQPNIGCALCESSIIPFLVPRRNVWLYQPRRRPKIVQSLVGLRWAMSLKYRSQGAKSVKICWVSQTGKPISAVSRPKSAILWGHLGESLLFNNFFSDYRYTPMSKGQRSRSQVHVTL